SLLNRRQQWNQPQERSNTPLRGSGTKPLLVPARITTSIISPCVSITQRRNCSPPYPHPDQDEAI
ncbi:MAG: hypothetical protein BRC50_00300, partial [Cyanobacteria bacterium SW_11_48_12]